MMQQKFKRPALLGALLFTGAALATPAHAISEQEEIQAGREMSKQAIQQYGQPLPTSDPRQQRVSRIGAMFARDGKRKNIPYSYTVLKNDTVLNAFAGPGGPIFVTTKLIDTASNDAELAYVLGHETGHVELKHIVKSVEKQQKVGIGVGILGAILGRGGGQAGNIVGALSNVGYTLWSKGFSRDQENQADDYGVHAMSRLGFDPRSAVSMLGKLGDGPEGLQRYLADHPTSEARRERVGNTIKKDNLVNVSQRAGGPFTSLKGASDNVYQTTSFGSDNGTNNGNTTTAGDAIPLRILESGGYRVVLAPVAEVANFAGGQVETRTDRVTVSRGGSYVTFIPDSSEANLNGRRVQLSAPARVIDGRFYAPLGTIASGLDGTATYDQTRNAIRLNFDGGRETYLSL